MRGKKTVDFEQIFRQTSFTAIAVLNKNTIKTKQKTIPTLPGGLDPPTFRLASKRASRLRHESFYALYHSTAIKSEHAEENVSGKHFRWVTAKNVLFDREKHSRLRVTGYNRAISPLVNSPNLSTTVKKRASDNSLNERQKKR